MKASLWMRTLALAVGAVVSLKAGEPVRAFHIPSLYHVGYWVRDIAKERAFYHDLLGFEEPYSLNKPTGELQMVIMKVNERQVIYLFPDASKILPNGDNLDHLGLETDDIAAAREHLLAHGVKVGAVTRGRIGDLLLGFNDPDGHHFELTQFAPEGQLLQHQGQSLPPIRVSTHLRAATVMVADLAVALHFYSDILGFKRVAADSPMAAGPGVVRLQVPDGDDFLDLVAYAHAPGTPLARGVPDYWLEVSDATKTAELLATRAKSLDLAGPSGVSASTDQRRETSVTDPDGTRVVLKEAQRQKQRK